MKTINDFFAAEEAYRVLTTAELQSVKGGDEPPTEEFDPFKKKIAVK